MKTAAIIPVKTFSKAKTRLDLPIQKKEDLCKIMFEEVINTLTISNKIDKVVIVSKDEEALKISKNFDSIPIIDHEEKGVNHAVSLADNFLQENGFDTSVVFPQDIPFMKTQDIEFLMNFENPPKYVMVVPSHRFDGTNALVRMPVNIMPTHYDEDSYKIHLNTAKSVTKNASLVFIRRIMLDVDSPEDLKILLWQREKPLLCDKIHSIIS